MWMECIEERIIFFSDDKAPFKMNSVHVYIKRFIWRLERISYRLGRSESVRDNFDKFILKFQPDKKDMNQETWKDRNKIV